MTIKTKYTTLNFKLQKEKVLAKMEEKIPELKHKTKSKQTKSVLSYPDV